MNYWQHLYFSWICHWMGGLRFYRHPMSCRKITLIFNKNAKALMPTQELLFYPRKIVGLFMEHNLLDHWMKLSTISHDISVHWRCSFWRICSLFSSPSMIWNCIILYCFLVILALVYVFNTKLLSWINNTSIKVY